MQRKAIIEQLAPWLIWTAFFLALAVFGTRTGFVATSNPRSLTQTSSTTAAPTDPCHGETLNEKR
ncbi:MAG TPA: hypothetical protein VGA10_11385 [Thermoanaerobaculia bacterium]